MGQLLFYVPDAVDPRFEDPGAWFNCTGTLIDADTVVTAGHCTYAVGVEGKVPANPLYGGTDVWFSVLAAPDYSILKPSSTYVPDRNALRYQEWSAALDTSPTWHEAESTFTHPEYDDNAFLLHDVGVVELSEPIVLPEYGSLPEVNYLDRYYSKAAKRTGLFESVGYGLEGSGPKFSFGGDTRRKADRRLVSFKGAYGYRNIAVMFSHRGGGDDRRNVLRRLRRAHVRHHQAGDRRREHHRRGDVVRPERQLQREWQLSPRPARRPRVPRGPGRGGLLLLTARPGPGSAEGLDPRAGSGGDVASSRHLVALAATQDEVDLGAASDVCELDR